MIEYPNVLHAKSYGDTTMPGGTINLDLSRSIMDMGYKAESELKSAKLAHARVQPW